MPDTSPQVVTYRPDGSWPVFLGSLGHVAALTYSDTMPGGPDSLSCTLQVHPEIRTPALNPGRIIQVHAGGSVVWDGKLDEPVPAADGWQVTAHGAGTYGAEYRAIWTSWTAANIIDAAISRGLRWTRGTIASGYLAEQQDSGAQTVTEFLEGYARPLSQTWHVGRRNVLSVFTIPTTVTRLLVATVPPGRTLAGYINALYVRYQVTSDSGGTATYGLTSATNAASITAHQRAEEYWDMTGAGVTTGSTAASRAASALVKYQAASYAGPFTAHYGQYLTTGGTPVDPACETARNVVQLIAVDGGYGGEVTPILPITFPAGRVAYNADDGTLEITPFQSVRSDLQGLLSALAPKQKTA